MAFPRHQTPLHPQVRATHSLSATSPPGNPDNEHEITIGAPAWPAHEAHGDRKGPCQGLRVAQSVQDDTPAKGFKMGPNGEIRFYLTSDALKFVENGEVTRTIPKRSNWSFMISENDTATVLEIKDDDPSQSGSQIKYRLWNYDGSVLAEGELPGIDARALLGTNLVTRPESVYDLLTGTRRWSSRGGPGSGLLKTEGVPDGYIIRKGRLISTPSYQIRDIKTGEVKVEIRERLIDIGSSPRLKNTYLAQKSSQSQLAADFKIFDANAQLITQRTLSVGAMGLGRFASGNDLLLIPALNDELIAFNIADKSFNRIPYPKSPFDFLDSYIDRKDQLLFIVGTNSEMSEFFSGGTITDNELEEMKRQEESMQTRRIVFVYDIKKQKFLDFVREFEDDADSSPEIHGFPSQNTIAIAFANRIVVFEYDF